MKKVGNVKGVRATGQLILVEKLTSQEAVGTVLHIGEDAKSPPQGYIVDIGPMIEADKWGFKVGDRVVLQGTYVPVPKFRGCGSRELGMIQPHDIKCVLVEESDEEEA